MGNQNSKGLVSPSAARRVMKRGSLHGTLEKPWARRKTQLGLFTSGKVVSTVSTHAMYDKLYVSRAKLNPENDRVLPHVTWRENTVAAVQPVQVFMGQGAILIGLVRISRGVGCAVHTRHPSWWLLSSSRQQHLQKKKKRSLVERDQPRPCQNMCVCDSDCCTACCPRLYNLAISSYVCTESLISRGRHNNPLGDWLRRAESDGAFYMTLQRQERLLYNFEEKRDKTHAQAGSSYPQLQQ